MKKSPEVIEAVVQPADVQATGALEGAEKFNRETVNWTPSLGSPDKIINSSKPLADARSRDMIQNDGYISGASTLHKDNIVGSQFLLNAQPNYIMLGLDEGWAEEFQRVVEATFNTIADSESNYFDASGRNTLTGLVRLAIGSFVMTGEVLATAEWLNRVKNRPFNTAIQMISPDRLSNPQGVSDDRFLRRGIRKDFRGKPITYYIRKSHPSELWDADSYQWAEVSAEKPWGRKMVIHIAEQLMPDQTRGISEMVSVLKQMKMTKHYQDIVLQNAVINASYAAAIESDLPTAQVFESLGSGSTDPMTGLTSYLSGYMGMMGQYYDSAKNVNVNGAKIPHLFPGTKLNLQPVGTPGGVGSGFEESLLRHIASGLGLSYEQFSRDYSKTNYSSARASMNETWKYMQSRKKLVADRFASNIYSLWLEEQIALGNIPLPAGKGRDWFYEPLVKDALTKASWIGASRGQIDEKKETESAAMRIQNNLSTLEEECGKLGKDWRQVITQRKRENAMLAEAGLTMGIDIAGQSNRQQVPAENTDANGDTVNEDEGL